MWVLCGVIARGSRAAGSRVFCKGLRVAQGSRAHGGSGWLRAQGLGHGSGLLSKGCSGLRVSGLRAEGFRTVGYSTPGWLGPPK